MTEGAETARDPRRGGEIVESFAAFGIDAFTTGRAAGSFGMQSDEPVGEVMARWRGLRSSLSHVSRLATAVQVHGAQVLTHDGEWRGWLRCDAADGHLSSAPATAMAVTIADCVPVFIAHPSGIGAVLHSGWRGTVARITEAAVRRLSAMGFSPGDLHVHCGPAICGRCYEVSADVAAQLTGRDPGGATLVDLRAIVASHARALGIKQISISPSCTKCDNDRFFSHRAGDSGRLLGVLATHG